MKYVSYKDKKAFANDLKTIYQAPSEKIAIESLEKVTEVLEKIYPRSVFLSDTTLLLYMKQQRNGLQISRNWERVYEELKIMYEDRFSE